VRELLTECWYLTLDPSTRRQRLLDRHVQHGRSPQEAEDWADGTDEHNAAFIDQTRPRADLIFTLADVN
jgi:hypothetical protein